MYPYVTQTYWNHVKNVMESLGHFEKKTTLLVVIKTILLTFPESQKKCLQTHTCW